MASTSSSSSLSISLLPSEPLPWRPNTRPKLPPGALLDIPDDLLWDLFTEWLLLEAVCRLDSALCQKSRRPYFLALLATKVLLFNREEKIRVLTDPDPYPNQQHDLFTHRALCAATLNWILKRGIHLASLNIPRSVYRAEHQSIRETVVNLAFDDRLDKLETISLFNCDYIKDAEIAAILSKCYRSVKSIDISGLKESAAAHIKRCTKLEAFTPSGKESAVEMVEIFLACRKLRKVDFSAFGDRLTDEVVQSLVVADCNLLEYLSLKCCYEVSDAAVKRVTESCPLLQVVDLTHTNINDGAVEALCKNFPLLKRLFLAACSRLTDAAVLAVAESLPGLTHIDLSSMRAITSSAVETLASKCRELEFINLTGCWNVSDAAIMMIAEHCLKLEWLNVTDCFYLTDAAVLAVAERLPGLTHIDLTGIEAITSSAVETLASKCRALESICLSCCLNVTDVTLSKIAELCSKLEVLNVSGTAVTAAGLTEIAIKCSKLKSVRVADRKVASLMKQKFLNIDWR